MDDGLATAWATLLAVLDDAEHDGDVVTPEQVQAAGRASEALRARGRAALEAATPYLWEYLDDVSETVGETLVDLPHGDAALWAHVHRVRRPGPYTGHLTVAAKYGDDFLGEIYG